MSDNKPIAIEDIKASETPVIVQGFALDGVPLKETAPEFVPVAGFDFAGFEHLVSTENEFMGMKGTITGAKMASSCMTPAVKAPIREKRFVFASKPGDFEDDNACSGNEPGQDGSEK